MQKSSRILITGGTGLVGRALSEFLLGQGYAQVTALSSRSLDLLDRVATARAFCVDYRPEFVFHLAGTVFGLVGNIREPGRIFLENTLMNTHVVEASRACGASKVVGMGSICAYPFPPHTPGPLKEDELLAGEPHPGERAYGHSKRAMLAQLEAYQASYGMDFAVALSTNLYGPHDRFNLETGHVIPSLVQKFFEAGQSGGTVEIWGDGTSTRDFMHSQDVARALVTIMDSLSGRVKLATGKMVSIGQVVETLAQISGVGNRVKFDSSKPRGHEFPGIEINRLRDAGFAPRIGLEDGLKSTFQWYAENHATARK